MISDKVTRDRRRWVSRTSGSAAFGSRAEIPDRPPLRSSADCTAMALIGLRTARAKRADSCVSPSRRTAPTLAITVPRRIHFRLARSMAHSRDWEKRHASSVSRSSTPASKVSRFDGSPFRSADGSGLSRLLAEKPLAPLARFLHVRLWGPDERCHQTALELRRDSCSARCITWVGAAAC